MPNWDGTPTEGTFAFGAGPGGYSSTNGGTWTLTISIVDSIDGEDGGTTADTARLSFSNFTHATAAPTTPCDNAFTLDNECYCRIVRRWLLVNLAIMPISIGIIREKTFKRC